MADPNMSMMTEINTQMSALSTPVQIWVNWMMLVLLLSVFFIRKHRPARFVFLAFLITMPAAMAIFYFAHNVHLFALAHIMVWTPLLVYLIRIRKSEGLKRLIKIRGPYELWQTLLMSTLFISLIFDVRDVFLVLIGEK